LQEQRRRGALIDGRNRLRACELAGVEPSFTVFEGDEDAVRAFIAEVNLERRDLKKGQKAMALAMLFPNGQRGRGGNGAVRKALETSDFSRQRLDQARSVLNHSRALAEDVLRELDHLAGLALFVDVVSHLKIKGAD